MTLKLNKNILLFPIKNFIKRKIYFKLPCRKFICYFNKNNIIKGNLNQRLYSINKLYRKFN